MHIPQTPHPAYWGLTAMELQVVWDVVIACVAKLAAKT